MRQALANEDMIAAFIARGGKIERVETGASIGITNREWKRLVRGDDVEEVEPIINAWVANQERKAVHLRAGHGRIA